MKCNMIEVVNMLKANKEKFDKLENSFHCEWNDIVHDSFEKFVFNRKKNVFSYDYFCKDIRNSENQLNDLKESSKVREDYDELFERVENICFKANKLEIEANSIDI